MPWPPTCHRRDRLPRTSLPRYLPARPGVNGPGAGGQADWSRSGPVLAEVGQDLKGDATSPSP